MYYNLTICLNGSFKLFLIKFSLGCLSLSISCVFLISLMSYDVNDPGFKTFQDNVSNDNISNLFGIFEHIFQVIR